MAATKRVAMDGGIFSPQLKGLLLMGLVSRRNYKSGYGWGYFLAATKRWAKWLWMGQLLGQLKGWL